MASMNRDDVAQAAQVVTPDTPNLHRIAHVVERLADWAGRNSDGWSYWRAPSAAADKACTILEDAGLARWNPYAPDDDCTSQAATRALSPVKALCTRLIARGVLTKDQRDWLIDGAWTACPAGADTPPLTP